jgi:hypothetical protein
METRLVTPAIRKISLPNQRESKKINLDKAYKQLATNPQYEAQFDKRKNPYQNWVDIKVQMNFEGHAKIFSNGTATTDIALPDELLLDLFEAIYVQYIKHCVEESK